MENKDLMEFDIRRVLKTVDNGGKIAVVIKNVAPSGTVRTLSFKLVYIYDNKFTGKQEPVIECIDYLFVKYLGYKRDSKRGGFKKHGSGLDVVADCLRDLYSKAFNDGILRAKYAVYYLM